jgi:predicted small secreted protein
MKRSRFCQAMVLLLVALSVAACGTRVGVTGSGGSTDKEKLGVRLGVPL